MPVTTRPQVLRLVEAGMSYEQIGDRLGIDPGLAFMIATGAPADGSDTLTVYDAERPGFRSSSVQHLANPPSENPTTSSTVLDWIKQRASNDAQMLEAAARRTADPGSSEDPEHETDVTTVLTRDHDYVTALLEQVSAIPGHTKGGTRTHIERRESIIDMVTVALSKHESIEQAHLWPTVREALPDGDQWVEQGLAQEQEATQTLTALGDVDAASEDFDELVERLVLQSRKHVAFEDRLFLALGDAMTLEQRRALGRRLTRAKAMAPTRPHPSAPVEPGPVAQIAAAPVAVADRARDATRRRPAARKGKAKGEAAEKRAEADAARENEDGAP
jgi:Hemerythrin HHE cation binding domain